MKKSLSALALAVLMFTAACTLIKKDIDVPQTFILEINQAADAPLQFSTSEVVSTYNEDVDEFKDEIDQFTIKSITCKVKQLSSANTPVISGTLKFAIVGTNNFQTLGSFNNIDAASLAVSGNEVEILNSNGTAKQEFINAVKAGNDIILQLEGSTSENPVAATLEIKVYSTITVEI